jgi:ABC-type Fe3+/spermidine/putrescine transport system ATPase subunit
MRLEAHNITKAFANNTVLHGVTFGAGDGEIVSLLGPSGCGKSTLLRVIAGLEADYQGTVLADGTAIDGVAVHERGFGLMFQDFALFPHRTVGQNIAFGPRMQKLDRREIERRVDDALQLVGLSGYGKRTIFELSGGERQRIALARALAPRPRLLLLDEPLGALDRTLREHLTDELRQIIKEAGITSVYVTHDQVEAFAVADRVVLMDAGRIVQSGTPAEVYQRPASPFVARFLGLNNLIPGTVEGTEGRVAHVRTALGTLHVTAYGPVATGAQVLVLIRPEAAAPATTATSNILNGTVQRTTFRGGRERIVVRSEGGIDLELDVEPGTLPPQGPVALHLRPAALTLVPEDRVRA